MYYATLTEVRAYLKFETAETADDALLTSFIRGACTFADNRLGGKFYPMIDTRYFDVPPGAYLFFNDHLLSLTTVTNGDGVAITLTDLTQFPATDYPKYGLKIEAGAATAWYPTDDGEYRQAIAIAGVWGYHRDYENAWIASGDAVADGAGINAVVTTINVSSASGAASDLVSPRFQAGQLIKIDSEYIDIQSIATNALTVKRGMYGSTAAAHLTAAPISIWRPDEDVRMGVIRLVAWRYRQKDANVFDQTTILGAGVKITPSAVPEDVLVLLPEPHPFLFA